jgi:outer membrane lipoprotein LolB
MNAHVKRILLLSFILLTGCASISQKQQAVTEKPSITKTSQNNTASTINTWDLTGKIAIRSPKDAFTASWQWHQNNESYTIGLYGPIGSNAIQLTGSPGAVSLKTSDGKKYKSSSPETLLEQQLGWRLPVSSLYYWIRGLPVPNVASQKERDTSGRLSILAQQGWRIEYSRYSTVKGVDLPAKIALNNDTLNVKIIINQWQI